MKGSLAHMDCEKKLLPYCNQTMVLGTNLRHPHLLKLPLPYRYLAIIGYKDLTHWTSFVRDLEKQEDYLLAAMEEDSMTNTRYAIWYTKLLKAELRLKVFTLNYKMRLVLYFFTSRRLL